MLVLIFLTLFSFLQLFLGQSIINIIAFLCLYTFAINIYNSLVFDSIRNTSSSWLELVRILLFLRLWCSLYFRYTQLQMYLMSKLLKWFSKYTTRILKSQTTNFYLNFLNSLASSSSLLYSRLSQNEMFYNNYFSTEFSFPTLSKYI